MWQVNSNDAEIHDHDLKRSTPGIISKSLQKILRKPPAYVGSTISNRSQQNEMP